MYIDSHTHLNSPILFLEWEKHILNFEKIGGKIIINAGSDDEYNKNGTIIAKEYKGDNIIKATIGFHPYEVVCGKINQENLKENINKLKKEYLENKEYVIAIGEAGIDIHYEGGIECIVMQKKLLEAQCKLAQELGLPIMIHSRDDFNSTIDVLKNYTDLKIYFHCRGYGPNEIKILENIFPSIWIGFCANISYPKAQNIRDSLAIVNKNNILLETDAPYLPPQEFRGKTNYPIYIEHIYKITNELLGLKKEQLEKIIYNNFKRLYKI